MRHRSTVFSVLFLSSLLLTAVLYTQAPDNHYLESFTTSEYKNISNTTAIWDTVAGQVKLSAFEPYTEGTYNTLGTAKGVDVDGDYVYVADGAYGLLVIDVSDVSNPTLLGSYDTPGDAERVQIQGKLAYVADGDSGIAIIDVSNAASPTLAGAYDTPGYAYEIFVAGDEAFVADGDSGLVILDVSDPTNPSLAGRWNSPATVYGVAVMAGDAYLAVGTAGMIMVDIANPAAPVSISTTDTPGICRGVTTVRDAAIVADDASGVHHIRTNYLPAVVLDRTIVATKARDVSSSGFWHYVADDVDGFKVATSIGSNIDWVYGYDTPGVAYGVAVDGAHAFVADGSAGLQCVRIGEPLNVPAVISTHDAMGYRVAAQGRFALVGTFNHEALLLRNYGSATILRGEWIEQNVPLVEGIAFEGNYCYFGNTGEFVVLDITLESPMAELARVASVGWIHDIVISGRHAITTSDNWLRIFDITDPTNPTIVSTLGIGVVAWKVFVKGDLAYVASDNSGAQIVDISDRSSPSIVGGYPTSDRAYDVAVAGDYAYVADYTSGLVVLDVSDPTSPVLAGSAATTGSLNYAVAVSGNIALLGSLSGGIPGLLMFDITDPTSPILRSSEMSRISDIKFVGNYTYSSGIRFYVHEIFQRVVKPDSNVAQSTEVDAASVRIHRALLTSTHVDSVGWQLSADGGSNWEWVTPGVTHEFANVGSDLRWRSTHIYAAKGNPSASAVDLVWRGPFEISSIDDVPNDQGQQVRISWTSGGNDIPGNANPTTAYHIYRQIDEGMAASSLPETGEPLEAAPPGYWHYVTTVPATGEYYYATVVPTLVDSSVAGNNHSAFFVRAMTDTPGLFWETAPDSGYSVDNLLPGVPTGFFVVYGAHGNQLRWNPSTDAGFDHYRVYRGATAGFSVDPPSLIHEATEVTWIDRDVGGGRSYYKLTMVDKGGNESRAASAWIASPDGPVIQAITDIDGDQGRRVSVRWQRSTLDSLGSATPITAYALYREHDPDLVTMSAVAPIHDDRPDLVYPPGEWDFVQTVPATLDSSYALVVPTLADSTITSGMYNSTFFIRALTSVPSVYHDSQPDSGYSVDDKPPLPVSGFSASYNTGGGNALAWDAAQDEDFKYFQIYRDVTVDFIPGPGNELFTTTGDSWTDATGQYSHYYKICAVDFSGNKGEPTGPDAVTGINSIVPLSFALYQNTPNPFNPVTTIRYDIPAPGADVSLTIYDVHGALVKRLFSGFETAGAKSASWDGMDARGKRVASGVYFYRLATPRYTESRKMVLLE